MSKLQNNFTTPEQSKRLLELGLSVDSADCYLNGDSVIILKGKTFQENYNEDLDLARLHLIEYSHYVPCWSVGRLIEIYGFGTNQHIGNIWYRNPMECIIADIEIAIENGEMDFSKLKK